jgi:transcriptional regulator with XRE-family HTH domain
MTTSLGETIKRLRTERGLSQQQFADMLYIDRSTCANWETGRRMPDAAMIVQIADVLGVETAYLMNVTKQANDVSTPRHLFQYGHTSRPTKAHGANAPNLPCWLVSKEHHAPCQYM